MFGSNQNNKHPSIHHTIGNTHGFVLIWHMVEDFHSFWLWCPISLNMIDLTLLWDINCQTKQITFDYGMQVNLASLNSKVQKWWLPQFLNFRYVFACDFYKQHLLHVTFYRRNEKIGAFIWNQKLHFDGWIPKWTFPDPISTIPYLPKNNVKVVHFIVTFYCA